jgi:hypothetical protein
VPSVQVPQDDLEERTETEIAKPVQFLREGDIENLYDQFKDEIERMREDGEIENKPKTPEKEANQFNVHSSEGESKDKASTGWIRVNKPADLPMKIVNFTDGPSSVISRAKSVPRPSRKALPNQLNENERKQLKEAIKQFTVNL